MNTKIEEKNTKKTFGKKVYENFSKEFGEENAKKISKLSNITILQYILTLQKNKNEVKGLILPQVKYAVKYGSWKHLTNILGDEFPVIRLYPDTVLGLYLWYCLDDLNRLNYINNLNKLNKETLFYFVDEIIDCFQVI